MNRQSDVAEARHTITVHLVCRDAPRAAAWYVQGWVPRSAVAFASRMDDSCRLPFASAIRR
jgi:hypothetical protein